MFKKLIKIFSIFFLLNEAIGDGDDVDCSEGYLGTDRSNQEWSHVQVRTGVQLFYWLYKTTHSDGPTRPLILWIQGGPSETGSGKGNFEEIGPVNFCGIDASRSLVDEYNVLFVDSPAGTGFSTVTSKEMYATTDQQITNDLIKLLQKFFTTYTNFQNVPLYIFGESYGGKMAVNLAYDLLRKRNEHHISCNLKAIGLGNAAISPKHLVGEWARQLFHTNKINATVYEEIQLSVNQAVNNIIAENWDAAYTAYENAFIHIYQYAEKFSFYNIHTFETEEQGYRRITAMTTFMNNIVKNVLFKNNEFDGHQWSYSNYDILLAVKLDFLKDCLTKLQSLIDDSSRIKVLVYNGRLDLSVCPAGTQNWIKDLTWPRLNQFIKHTPMTPIWFDNQILGDETILDNFAMFWVNNAGHSVPPDNPAFMKYMLRRIATWQ